MSQDEVLRSALRAMVQPNIWLSPQGLTKLKTCSKKNSKSAEGAAGAAHHGWAAPGENFKFGVPKCIFKQRITIWTSSQQSYFDSQSDF